MFIKVRFRGGFVKMFFGKGGGWGVEGLRNVCKVIARFEASSRFNGNFHRLSVGSLRKS